MSITCSNTYLIHVYKKQLTDNIDIRIYNSLT